MSDDAALFAGDVMGTGWHAVDQAGVRPGDSVAVLGLGPVGLCAVQAAKAAGAAKVIAIDTVADRLELAASFGAEPVHLTEDDPRAAVKSATDGRGVDAAIDAVGHPGRARPGRARDPQGGHGRRRSASTPSASRCTWASSGSRRSRSRPATPT